VNLITKWFRFMLSVMEDECRKEEGLEPSLAAQVGLISDPEE
jgi:hypothetical protein